MPPRRAPAPWPHIDQVHSPSGRPHRLAQYPKVSSTSSCEILLCRRYAKMHPASTPLASGSYTIPTEGNPDDMREYITDEMDIAGDQAYRNEVTSQLLQRAQGNFLWIHLAVQKINTCHTKLSVESALRDLPAGMGHLYDRMATSVRMQSGMSDDGFGMEILGWVTCSRRVLTVNELSDALYDSHLLKIQRSIGDLCGVFVVPIRFSS